MRNMPKSTNCSAGSSKRELHFNFVSNEDKKTVSYSQHRHSNPVLDGSPLKNKDNSSSIHFCHRKDHDMATARMGSTSTTKHSSSRQFLASSRVFKQNNYRRSQSNSIFELCSCLSTSSLSSTNSSS